MNRPTLPMQFDDVVALARELAANLRHGRAFVRTAEPLQLDAPCELLLYHPTTGDQLVLGAVVRRAYPADTPGTGGGLGLELEPFNDQVRAAVEEFAAPRRTAADSQRSASQPVASRLAKLRGLSGADQHKLARTGDLDQRVALERIYGKGVWDTLLQNPRITVAEVARIARKGTVPQILLDTIADNSTWARTPPVRRALLSNRRMGTSAIDKILRLTPKHELKIIPRQSAYPAAVRSAAQRLLKQG